MYAIKGLESKTAEAAAGSMQDEGTALMGIDVIATIARHFICI